MLAIDILIKKLKNKECDITEDNKRDIACYLRILKDLKEKYAKAQNRIKELENERN